MTTLLTMKWFNKTAFTFTVTFTETSDPTQFNPVYSDDATWLTPWSTEFDKFFWYSAVRLNTSWVETNEITQEDSGWYGKLDITQLWTLTSGDNVMIKFPRLWVKMEKSWSNITLSITSANNKTWYQYYAHSRWTFDNQVEKQILYMWAYEWCNVSNVIKSLSWQYPGNYMTLSNSINYARANDNNSWNGWYDICWFYQRQFVNALYMMKYWNPNSQSIIGGWYSARNSSPVNTWWTDNQLNATYWTSSYQQQIKLFGLEDWRGNLDERIWGICTVNWALYTALSWFVWERKTTSPYQRQGSYPAWTTNPCISDIAWTNGAMFYPASTVNNDSWNTYWCDAWAIYSTRGWALAGGNWRSNTQAGAFRIVTENNTSSLTYGTRLMYL